MPRDRSRHHFIAGANKAMEEILRRSERSIVTSYRLVGAILFFGGAGYLLDRGMGTAPWFLVTGIVVGVVVGFVGLYRLVR